MRTKAAFVGVILCLLPGAARAAKVAIVPVEYVQVQSGEARDAAVQVEDKVAEGAREAGYEVVRGAAVADAVKASAACAAAARDRACLEAVAEALGADEAIAVSVTDDDHTTYRVEVVHARRDKVVDERTAGFFVVLEWVRGTVALTLQRPASQAPQPASSQKSQESQKSQTAPVPPAAPVPGTSDSPRPLHRAAFWTGVGVTGALVVAFAATDIATSSRYNDLKDERAAARSQADWDAAHRLQVADRVLLGFSLAAAVATTVMAFFTEFGGEDEIPPTPFVEGGASSSSSSEEESASSPPLKKGAGGISALAPFALPNGGGLALEGRF